MRIELKVRRAMLFMTDLAEAGPGGTARAVDVLPEVKQQTRSDITRRLMDYGLIAEVSRGVYELSRPARKIALSEIIEAMSGPLVPQLDNDASRAELALAEALRCMKRRLDGTKLSTLAA